MRTIRRMGIALLAAIALTTPVSAQTIDPPLSVNAAVGPSFATLGTTFSTTAAIDYNLNRRATLVGEFGLLPHAAFRDASEIAPAATDDAGSARHVNAYHWNANLRLRPFERGRLEPYFTAGLGAFAADTVVGRIPSASTLGDSHRRLTDFATNVGAGVLYRLNDWVGVTADYRTFFIHRENDTPYVNRFTAGLRFSLK
jgi:opacity protein-like surface antigen